MNKNDLPDKLYETMSALSGKGTVVEVSKKFWEMNEQELSNSGDLFYTWQYDIRWAATKLRDAGKIKQADDSPKGVWELTTPVDEDYFDIEDALQKIGKAVFVNFFSIFSDESLTDEEKGDIVYKLNKNSRSSKQSFRIPRVNQIFERGLEYEALKIIANSERVEESAREKARQILDKHTDE